MFEPPWEVVDAADEPADTDHGHEWSVSHFLMPGPVDAAVTLALTQYEWGEPTEVRAYLLLDEAERLAAALTEACRRQREHIEAVRRD